MILTEYELNRIINNDLDENTEILENSDESKIVIKTDLGLYLFIELINYGMNFKVLSNSDVLDYIKLNKSDRIIILKA